MIFVNWLCGFPKWSSSSIRDTQIFESTERCSPRWAGRTAHGEWSSCQSRSKRSTRRLSHPYLKRRLELGAGVAAQKSGLPEPPQVQSNRRHSSLGAMWLLNASLRSISEHVEGRTDRLDCPNSARSSRNAYSFTKR